jgi:hypothetical protein
MPHADSTSISGVRAVSFQICCKVTGGRTGPRAGWLKGVGDEPRVFATEAEAIDMVRRLDDAMRTFGGDMIGTYTVCPVTT